MALLYLLIYESSTDYIKKSDILRIPAALPGSATKPRPSQSVSVNLSQGSRTLAGFDARGPDLASHLKPSLWCQTSATGNSGDVIKKDSGACTCGMWNTPSNVRSMKIMELTFSFVTKANEPRTPAARSGNKITEKSITENPIRRYKGPDESLTSW